MSPVRQESSNAFGLPRQRRSGFACIWSHRNPSRIPRHQLRPARIYFASETSFITAQSTHYAGESRCLLSGVKRTSADIRDVTQSSTAPLNHTTRTKVVAMQVRHNLLEGARLRLS